MSSTADITLEKSGVIAVSKALCQQLGLVPGMLLVVESANNGVSLRVKKPSTHLQYEDQVLLFTGDLVEYKTDAIQDDREVRMLTLVQ